MSSRDEAHAALTGLRDMIDGLEYEYQRSVSSMQLMVRSISTALDYRDVPDDMPSRIEGLAVDVKNALRNAKGEMAEAERCISDVHNQQLMS